MRRLVVIPTYNEVTNAPILISRLLKWVPDCEILVIDDGSPDGTAESVHSLTKEESRLSLVTRDSKLGLGSAYRFGFEWGLARGFDEFIEMDADLSHRVRDLKLLIDAKSANPAAELVIGSRWITGGSITDWSWHRELLSRIANRYVRLALGLGVNDSTSGFRIYSASLLRRINLDQIKSEGYSFQIEMTRAAARVGAKIVEVPITFRERSSGVSKMSGRIVFEAMGRVTLWGIKRILGSK